MRLHSNDQVAPGHVLVLQSGEILLCRLRELQYVPGDDSGTDMHVNPADFAAAKAMWFEPKGAIQ